ncbi:MAG TPA: alanine racemase [Ktedonobacteraceae bacterium]|nr:alanine racemase [Ktedonobacteraceae bacterium]
MIYLDHLLKATAGTLIYPGKQERFEAFSHDTRQLLPGELFVAVRGEHGNGHDYVLDAAQKGAGGLLAEAQTLAALPEETHHALETAAITTIAVDDTRLALQQYAQFILQRWHPTVIAVTGSTGKTSTKEAIASVLASHFATFKSWQNYNDLLGLPLSLGRLEERHEYAVLELGCDHPGEIGDLCRVVRPHIGVLTNISPAQLQYFGTVEALANELGTLLSSLPATGTAIVNYDDDLVRALLIETPMQAAIVPFAASLVRDVRVSWNGIQGELPISGYETPPHTREVHLASRLLGEHHISTLLAAFLVGQQCGLQPEEVQQSLVNTHPQPGRLNPLPGLNASTLLDDTHNATPASMLAGLETLKALAAGRRIAVLGDMLRLGDYEETAHHLVGQKAAHCVDYLITKGERAALIAEAARQAGLDAGRVIVTSTHEDAAQAVRRITAQPLPEQDDFYRQHHIKDTILIKGSEETRMERVTEQLMEEPGQAPERLVRQTPGWKQVVIMQSQRPTWVEIDLSAIGNNTRQVRALVGPEVRILVSLKADAYGHGALKVARTVLHNGASMLGVATVSEAIPLREAGINAPILVFGYVPLWQMREAVRLNLTITLYASESALALSRAAQALKKTVRVHVKVDSGMGRLGIRAEQVEDILALIREIKSLPGLELEGMFTHFAMADSSDLTHARMQLSRFQQVLRAVEAEHLRPPIIHASNSAAMLQLPEARFDMVRPGIAIYGLDPSPDARLPQGFRPALSFKTTVAQVKDIPAGECIGYGCTFVTERPTRIAVLPVGYADGFRRGPANWGSVLIHGQQAPILGRVCMDQCMVDVTDIPQVRMGDEVVLIGQQSQATLTAEQVARRLGTINYEVVSAILARVPRVD